MKKFFTPFLFSTILFSYGCASSYRPISPPVVNYDYAELSSDGGLTTFFAYDLLTLRKNKKYARKETKSSLKVVSVKVVNNTSTTLHLGRDCRLMLGSREIIPVNPDVAANKLKQGVPLYLLYSLLIFNITKETYNGYYTESKSFSIPVGIPIAAANMWVAGNANSRMRTEIVGQNILNKTIAPGETAYGIVCINENMTGRLKFEVNTVH